MKRSEYRKILNLRCLVPRGLATIKFIHRCLVATWKVVKNLTTIVAWLPMASNQAVHTSWYGRMYFIHVFFLYSCLHALSCYHSLSVYRSTLSIRTQHIFCYGHTHICKELSCHPDLAASHFHSFSYICVQAVARR